MAGGHHKSTFHQVMERLHFSRRNPMKDNLYGKTNSQEFSFVGAIVGMVMVLGAMLLLAYFFSDQPLF